MKQIIIKRILQLFARIAEEDEEKFKKIVEVYGSVFKLGAVEDTKNREKLTALTRFTTTQRNHTSLDQVAAYRLKTDLSLTHLFSVP